MNRDDSEPPALIDYGVAGGSSASWGSPENHWRTQLVSKHRMSAHPFTIKDRSLWKRLREQFGDDLIDMIDTWMDMHHEGVDAADFIKFYVHRGQLYAKIQPPIEDYGFDT